MEKDAIATYQLEQQLENSYYSLAQARHFFNSKFAKLIFEDNEKNLEKAKEAAIAEIEERIKILRKLLSE